VPAVVAATVVVPAVVVPEVPVEMEVVSVAVVAVVVVAVVVVAVVVVVTVVVVAVVVVPVVPVEMEVVPEVVDPAVVPAVVVAAVVEVMMVQYATKTVALIPPVGGTTSPRSMVTGTMLLAKAGSRGCTTRGINKGLTVRVITEGVAYAEAAVEERVIVMVASPETVPSWMVKTAPVPAAAMVARSEGAMVAPVAVPEMATWTPRVRPVATGEERVKFNVTAFPTKADPGGVITAEIVPC